MPSKTPVKLFYRIGEVAQLLKLETHTLRYWEQQFSVIRPRKSANGHRVYRRVDVERLEALRDLLYREGYTIAGVKRRIKEEGVHFFSQQEKSEADKAPMSIPDQEHSQAKGQQSPPVAAEGLQNKDSVQVEALFEKLRSLREEMEEELLSFQEED